MTSDIHWDTLGREMAARFVLGPESIHGPSHWRRVERHAIQLVTHGGGDLVVVRLFALLHDVCRRGDGRDDHHGARGAELAGRLRGIAFSLTDAQFALLQDACIRHTDGQLSDDPTIGACWDADRLDIWRAGYTPQERYLSTAYARALARAGMVGPDYTP